MCEHHCFVFMFLQIKEQDMRGAHEILQFALQRQKFMSKISVIHCEFEQISVLKWSLMFLLFQSGVDRNFLDKNLHFLLEKGVGKC